MTYGRTRRDTMFYYEYLECHHCVVPLPLEHFSTDKYTMREYVVGTRMQKTYKPPDPISGPNSTSYDVIIHVSNST